MSNEENERKKNFTYNVNHQAIERAFLDYIKDNGTHPTQKQICEITGLSPRVVCKHFSEMTISNFMPEYKKWSPMVMRGIFTKAKNGNPHCAKLWMQIVEGLTEKKEHTGKNGQPLFPHNPYANMTEEELDAELAKRISFNQS